MRANLTTRRSWRFALLATVVALSAAACNGDDGEPDGTDNGGEAVGEETREETGEETRGPFDIWYSNNPAEIEWAQAQVDRWNEEHADEQITAQEIPAGATSEEVIIAAIAAGNAPCLIYNVAPAAVPMFERQGGLVSLADFDGADDFVTDRVGEGVDQYRSEDGSLYQMPWKANPVMIIYNRELFAEAGLDTDDPPLSTYDEFLETSRTLVEEGSAEAAIWPAPSSEFFQSWFDFYPLFAAATDGTLLVEDGVAEFDSPEGHEVAGMWRTMYEEGLSPQEAYQGDAFGEQVSAMSIVGPWAVAVYEDLDWGVVPVPTADGSGEDVWTFSDAKSVGMFTACENRDSAWEFLQQTMSDEADRELLEVTGQMPMRDGLTDLYADYFEENPEYAEFADQTARMIEVPNVPNSIEIWQEFRSAYSRAVIFGEGDIEDEFAAAAETVEGLAAQ
jgi:multiple sugar transport system substrate-binding protein